MGLALRLFLLLLLAVALPARAAQGDQLQARRADLHHELDYLEGLLNDTLNVLENARAEPVAEGDLASQPTSRTELLGDGEGVSAGRTFPGPLVDVARKPSSHRRGPLRMNNKRRGDSKSLEASKQMDKMQSNLERRRETDQKGVQKDEVPRGSTGSLTACAAGREAMSGPVRGAEPVAEGDLASQPTFRIEPVGDGEGVSAGRTFPAPLVDVARKPSSHHRGPLRMNNKRRGDSKSLKASIQMDKMQSDLERRRGIGREVLWKAAFPAGREAIPDMGLSTGDWDRDIVYLGAHDSLKTFGNAGAEPVAEGDLASQPTFRIEPLGDGEVMDQPSVQEEAHPGGSRGRLTAPAEAKDEMPDTGTGTGGEAGTISHVPDSQEGPGTGSCKGTGFWLWLMAGLLCLELIIVLCCVGIWCYWKRKQSTSAASQGRPNNSAGGNWTCHEPCSIHCYMCLPPRHYELIAVEVQPPARTGASVPQSAGPGVRPGPKAGPSCQGRA